MCAKKNPLVALCGSALVCFRPCLEGGREFSVRLKRTETRVGTILLNTHFAKFVVDTVITGPVIDASLIGKGVAQHEEEANWKACFI